MTQFRVDAVLHVTYLVDTKSASYDYVFMDNEGNPLTECDESVRLIEAEQTIPNLKVNGNSFNPHVRDSYIERVRNVAEIYEINKQRATG